MTQDTSGGDGIAGMVGTPAKSGDQDVEVGDVFMGITEKARFPGFRLFGGWNLALGRGRRRLPEKKLRSECARRIETGGS